MATDDEIRLRDRLSRLRSLPLLRGARLSGEVERLERRLERMQGQETDPDIWRSVQLARDENRPYSLDSVGRLFEDWVELHGDRGRADDAREASGRLRARRIQPPLRPPRRDRAPQRAPPLPGPSAPPFQQWPVKTNDTSVSG